MGTRFELVLPAGQREAGELAIALVDDWHQRLSRFAPDSWVSHVNRTAMHTPVRCDADTWALLRAAQYIRAASGGAFDITRGDGEHLLLDPDTQTIRFAQAGMSIDLGGIAKGHALDACARLLTQHGVTSAFMHGGTSSGVAIGHDPDGRPWRVRVSTTTLSLTDAAFAVSSADSQPGLHIVDPATGLMVEAGAVYVTGPSALVCDGWATALVVSGQPPAGFPVGYVHGASPSR